MTFGEKLKKLRTDSNMTQEELAQALYVSRTAISKWESGRGLPNIESLKALAARFAVSVDELLSGDELVALAEEDQREKETRTKALVFGLLDCGVLLLFFLPFFAQTPNGVLQEVPLLALAAVQPYVKALYFAWVVGSAVVGLVTMLLRHGGWLRHKFSVSAAYSAIGVVLFIVGRQPYAAVFAFTFLMIKAIMLIKRR